MEQVKEMLETICREERIAGMAVAITDREKTIFASGFGVESAERPTVPVTADSLFRIASITKIFTGMTILRLVEEGALSLDIPVKTYVPQLRLRDALAEETITLRQLLSHSAGFPKEYTPDGPLEESMLESVLLSDLAGVELVSKPGTAFLYSNWGIRLASLAAQKVTGKPFTVLAKQYILDHLGMERTTFDLHVAATYPICLAHREENGVFHVVHRIQENATRYAAGGLFSSARELTAMARLLLNDGVADSGKELLSKTMMAEMKKEQCSPEYGLTLKRVPYGTDLLYGHYGSAPPYATSLLVHPASGLGVVTLMNTERNHLRYEIPKKILDLLVEKRTLD